jgi:methyl-accepting chemotaxis protein
MQLLKQQLLEKLGVDLLLLQQEVRNLASRSAEAANEIKALVENATLKSNQGKDIAALQ